MNYPVFLDIETSSAESEQFPTVISWSLPDGTLKSVIILPSDEWEPWDNSDADTDLQHLFDQGVSPLDIVRELNDDLAGQTVFVDGLDDDENLLHLLYEACNNEPDFELASLGNYSLSHSSEQLLELTRSTAEQHGFNQSVAEENVRALLFMSQSLSESEIPL